MHGGVLDVSGVSPALASAASIVGANIAATEVSRTKRSS